MSINRINEARQIIESKLTGPLEKVGGDYSDEDQAGWWVFPVHAASVKRATELGLACVVALGKAGYTAKGRPATPFWAGSETRGAVAIRVEVGNVRSL